MNFFPNYFNDKFKCNLSYWVSFLLKGKFLWQIFKKGLKFFFNILLIRYIAFPFISLFGVNIECTSCFHRLFCLDFYKFIFLYIHGKFNLNQWFTFVCLYGGRCRSTQHYNPFLIYCKFDLIKRIGVYW